MATQKRSEPRIFPAFVIQQADGAIYLADEYFANHNIVFQQISLMDNLGKRFEFKIPPQSDPSFIHLLQSQSDIPLFITLRRLVDTSKQFADAMVPFKYVIHQDNSCCICFALPSLPDDTQRFVAIPTRFTHNSTTSSRKTPVSQTESDLCTSHGYPLLNKMDGLPEYQVSYEPSGSWIDPQSWVDSTHADQFFRSNSGPINPATEFSMDFQRSNSFPVLNEAFDQIDDFLRTPNEVIEPMNMPIQNLQSQKSEENIPCRKRRRVEATFSEHSQNSNVPLESGTTSLAPGYQQIPLKNSADDKRTYIRKKDNSNNSNMVQAFCFTKI